MQRGSLTTKKEEAIAKKILQVIAEENLTNGEVKRILDIAKNEIDKSKFTCP